MLTSFQKSKLKKTGTFSREVPSVLKVFEYYFPNERIRQSSRAHMALCPFHGEHNPSFAMYPDTNSYYCFTCGVSGGVLKLIMELENCSFKEALTLAKEKNLYD